MIERFCTLRFFGSPSSTAKNLNGPLNTKSCLGMLHESARTGNIQLYRKVLRFIEENFLNVVNNNGEVFYRRVCVNVFETLLESEKLQIKNEDEALLAVRKWLQFDFRQRRRFALQLLGKVRLGCVSRSVLGDISSDRNYEVMLDPASKALLNDAIANRCPLNPRPSTLTKIYSLGTNSLVYDSLKGTWENWHIDGGGIQIQGSACVLVVQNLYVINKGKTVSIVNMKTKTVKSGLSMLTARTSLSVCVNSNNVIYAMGNTEGDNTGFSVEVLLCNRAGEPIGAWQSLAFANRPSCNNHVSAIVNDKVYLITPKTCLVSEPKLNKWNICASPLQRKERQKAFAYNGEVYVLSTEDIAKYNPLSDSWAVLATVPSGWVEGSPATVMNDKICVLAGPYSDDLNIYNIKMNTWSKGPSIPGSNFSLRRSHWSQTLGLQVYNLVFSWIQ